VVFIVCGIGFFFNLIYNLDLRLFTVMLLLVMLDDWVFFCIFRRVGVSLKMDCLSVCVCKFVVCVLLFERFLICFGRRWRFP